MPPPQCTPKENIVILGAPDCSAVTDPMLKELMEDNRFGWRPWREGADGNVTVPFTFDPEALTKNWGMRMIFDVGSLFGKTPVIRQIDALSEEGQEGMRGALLEWSKASGGKITFKEQPTIRSYEQKAIIALTCGTKKQLSDITGQGGAVAYPIAGSDGYMRWSIICLPKDVSKNSTMVHEAGHSLGLPHPHSSNILDVLSSNTLVPGARGKQCSVMAYPNLIDTGSWLPCPTQYVYYNRRPNPCYDRDGFGSPTIFDTNITKCPDDMKGLPVKPAPLDIRYLDKLYKKPPPLNDFERIRSGSTYFLSLIIPSLTVSSSAGFTRGLVSALSNQKNYGRVAGDISSLAMMAYLSSEGLYHLALPILHSAISAVRDIPQIHERLPENAKELIDYPIPLALLNWGMLIANSQGNAAFGFFAGFALSACNFGVDYVAECIGILAGNLLTCNRVARDPQEGEQQVETEEAADNNVSDDDRSIAVYSGSDSDDDEKKRPESIELSGRSQTVVNEEQGLPSADLEIGDIVFEKPGASPQRGEESPHNNDGWGMTIRRAARSLCCRGG